MSGDGNVVDEGDTQEGLDVYIVGLGFLRDPHAL
jgi:hypothetical protein